MCVCAQIFNTHLKDTVPEGVEGAIYVNATPPDSRGVRGGNFWRINAFGDHMVRDSFREPMALFHTQFARCLRGSPSAVRFWKHAFESAYLFPQHLNDPQATHKPRTPEHEHENNTNTRSGTDSEHTFSTPGPAIGTTFWASQASSQLPRQEKPGQPATQTMNKTQHLTRTPPNLDF